MNDCTYKYIHRNDYHTSIPEVEQCHCSVNNRHSDDSKSYDTLLDKSQVLC